MSLATRTRPVPLTESTPGRVSVLIVDDNPMMRLLAREILGMAGDAIHVVGEAADGPSAVTAIMAEQPDIVLCDVDMPGMAGPEVVREVRQQRPDQRFMFWSASTTTALQRLEAETGVRFVTKDNVEELARVLVSAVTGPTARRAD